MIILDGKKLSEKILDNLRKEISAQGGSASGGKNRPLKLAVVLVGQDRVSGVFIKQKEKACKKVGIGFELYQFGKNISAEELKKEIENIGKAPFNSGVVVQLPLPSHINIQEVLNAVPFEKDIDVLSEESFEKFSRGKSLIIPPTVGAVSYLLKEYKINIKGKYVVVVGAGRLVGKPLAAWLKLQGVNFSILDKSTEDISAFTKKADILISGVGKANLIKKDMVKEGAIVIDVGSSIETGMAVGDIEFKSVSQKASYITPVPGGVGPMTVACLLENLVKLSK